MEYSSDILNGNVKKWYILYDLIEKKITIYLHMPRRGFGRIINTKVLVVIASV